MRTAIMLALCYGSRALSPHLADLPPIALKLAGELPDGGTEQALNAHASSLILRLSGDSWDSNASSSEASRNAILSSFESLQPHEPAGWTAVVAPALNSSLPITRSSATELRLQLPRLRCYDLLYPEIIMLRLPGAVTASGRAVVAPPLRIRADPTVRPPRWGEVRAPPREIWRNCTHVTLSWAHPADSGGSALAGYKFEVRFHPTSGGTTSTSSASSSTAAAADQQHREGSETEPLSLGPALDAGWNASTTLIAPQSDQLEASATVGPLEAGIAYEVRIRAYSTGTGCSPVPGDDGASIILYGGWRADSLEVDAGPMRSGPVHGGTTVSIRGACLNLVSKCIWEPIRTPQDANGAAGMASVGEAKASVLASISSAVLTSSEAELQCGAAAVAFPGVYRVGFQLSGGGATALRSTGLSFEYYSIRATELAPAAGPVAGGSELRVSVDVSGSLELRRAIVLGDARCRFDGPSVTTTTFSPIHASAYEVICPTPAATAVGPVNVSVSIDAGRAFTAPLPADKAFLYYNVSLGQVRPLGGPVRGGTIATIVGDGLAGGHGEDGGGGGAGSVSWCTARPSCAVRLTCRFGTLGGRVPVLAANESSITCIAPPTLSVASGGAPLLAAAVDLVESSRLVGGLPWDGLFYASDALSYTLSGEEYTESHLQWTYYVPPTVSSLQPADGPASGGHEVTIRGEGFMRLPMAGAEAARCRFGRQITPVVEIRNDSFLVCKAPSDHAARDAALTAPIPSQRDDRPARGIGEDAKFELVHSGRHCCAVGAGAARVGGGSGYNSQADCEAGCVSAASCRFFSYASSTSKCDLCSTCTDDYSYHASDLAANRSWARSFDSFKRIEPALPALMPFALSLNGQQYELNDADWTAELGYVMYAATVYNLSIGGGPISGGTLVTLTGRGFARAGARPASAPRRFGTLWWHRNASIAPRCHFGVLGTTTPLQLRDDEIVCPTPLAPTATADAATGMLVTGLTLALNAAHFEGQRPIAAAANASFDAAHFEGALSPTSPQLGVPLSLTLYEQRISAIHPPGGPTVGGTVVRVDGVGLHRFVPNPIACTFGVVPSDAVVSDDSTQPSSTRAINCTSPPLAPRNATPFRVALNYQRRECEPSVGLLSPAYTLADGPRGTAFDPAECFDGYRLEVVSGPGFRGSFRPREGIPFDYYVPPVISAIFPVRGSHSGGTPITVTGHGLRRVDTAELLCGFGLSGSTPFPPPDTTTPAELRFDLYEPLAARLALLADSLPEESVKFAAWALSNKERDAVMDAASIVCPSPRRTTSGVDEVLSVAPNGQDFEGGGFVSRFTFLEALLLNSSFPLGGPVAGGPMVRIMGTGFVNVTDGTLRCKFGDAEVNASYMPIRRSEVEGILNRGVYAAAVAADQQAVLACIAPRAHQAGATLLIRRDFDHGGPSEILSGIRPASSAATLSGGGSNGWPGGGRGDDEEGGTDELRGDAIVEGRSLRLTHRVASGIPSVGTLIIARDRLAPASVVVFFEASFELQMGDTGAGRGLSFSYGKPPVGARGPPPTVDEKGLEVGLSVCLFSEIPPAPETPDIALAEHRMEVRYDGEVIERIYVGRSLQTAVWANLTIKYDQDGLEVRSALEHNSCLRPLTAPNSRLTKLSFHKAILSCGLSLSCFNFCRWSTTATVASLAFPSTATIRPRNGSSSLVLVRAHTETRIASMA